MNFLPATIENGVAKLPMASVPLPKEVLDRVGRVDSKKNLIAGIRPEDFEDVAMVAEDVRDRGTTFKTKFDLVEAMGAEYYVHFGVKADALQSSSHMDALLDDQGGVTETTDEGDTVIVARLDAESNVKVGQTTEVWIDASKMHFFDAGSGESLSS
jgi:multiple sugar transport system ATP-binding protein